MRRTFCLKPFNGQIWRCVIRMTCWQLWYFKAYLLSLHTSQTHLCISSVADELQKAMKYMKYFIICIFASTPLLCVTLCRGMEYQVAISSDQPSLQDKLSCFSISIHCVWTALGELHPESEAYMHAQLTVFFLCKWWCHDFNGEQIVNMHTKAETGVIRVRRNS